MTHSTYFETNLGRIVHGDAVDVLKNEIPDGTVNLIVTSPPFALLREKDYGNAHQDHYLDWFRPFGELFHRALRDDGSLVIDIGGSWKPGQPTRSLYHFKLDHAGGGDGISSRAGILLVEPGEAAYAGRVGERQTDPGKGCRQLRVVAFEVTLAPSRQPARSPAIQPSDAQSA